jgi:hypothetical protein
VTGSGAVPGPPAGPGGPTPSDPGLQAERTVLSWRRTAMSVAVGSLVAFKLLPPYLGPLGYVAATLGLLWGLDLVMCARHRYHDADRALRADLGREDVDLVGHPGPGSSRWWSLHVGQMIARTALVTGIMGVAALLSVLLVMG